MNNTALDHESPTPTSIPNFKDDMLDIRFLLTLLWRRKWIITSVTILALITAFVAIKQITPLYRSTAKVMIESDRTNVVGIEAVMSGLSGDKMSIQSEIQVIRSYKLIGSVVDALNLVDHPQFTAPASGFLASVDWYSFLPENPASFLTETFSSNINNVHETERASMIRNAVINELLADLDVHAMSMSRVIEISYPSPDSALAQAVTEAITDTYLNQQLEAKFEATQRATNWLSERLGGLRDQVLASEKAVEIFRSSHDLLKGKTSTTLIAQQISDLNGQLIVARQNLAHAESLVREISSHGEIDQIQGLNSPGMDNLLGNRAALLGERAQLEQRYKSRHPKMIEINTKLKELDQSIKNETRKIVNKHTLEANVTRRNVKQIEIELTKLKNRMAKDNRLQVQLRSMESEAEANRTLYETFLNRFKETSNQKEIQTADARLLSPSIKSRAPYFPQTKIALLFALLFGGGLGVFIAFLIEYFDQGFRSMQQIEQLTGISALGLVPELPSMAKLGKGPSDYVVDKPISAYGEAIRTVRTGLLLSDVDNPPKVILVTSATPREGKTNFCISLARLAGMAGQRVLLIDCDLRRPSIHRTLRMENNEGIVEVLMGARSVEDIIQTDERTGIHVISAGQSVPNPADLLASQHMRQLLADLKKRYDLIIMDSPPIVAVADPRVLSLMVDKTIFLLRWAETRREVVMMALKQLREAGSDLAGLVLTRVNIRQHASYGYGDSGYYYLGYYKKYYTQ